MKKIRRNTLIALLILSVFLTLSACGGKETLNDMSNTSTGQTGNVTADDTDSPDETTTTSVGAELYYEIIPFIYEDALDFAQGLAAVKLNGKWGFIDKSGAEVIPFIYELAQSFSEDLAAVKLDGKWGFINKTGSVVIDFKYAGASSFSEGMCVVQLPDIASLDPHLLYIDKTGTEITPLYYSAYDFSEGLAMVQHGMMNYIYIDRLGNEVISITSIAGTNYRGNSFSDGLALIYHFDNHSFIDKAGNVVIDLEDYRLVGSVESFSENLALVETQGFGRGYLDKTGQLVISHDSLAMSFSEGLAVASFSNGFGYIDKTGETVIAGKYDWANDFSEGIAAVELDGKWGFINAAGEEIVPCIYDDLMEELRNIDFDEIEDYDGSFHIEYFVSEGMAAVRLDGMWGFIAIPSAKPVTPVPVDMYIPEEIPQTPATDNRIYEVTDILTLGAGRVRFGEYIWRVLAVEDGKALLMTENIIERRPFNVEWRTITWEQCDVRKYLNGEFYDGFSAEEKNMISRTNNDNPDNPWYGTAAGNSTNDYVFLLSIEEVVRYFGDSGQLSDGNPDDSRRIDDEYNKARIATDIDGGAGYWWLRSFGEYSSDVAVVDHYGIIHVDGDVFAKETGGVRPALWLNLE